MSKMRLVALVGAVVCAIVAGVLAKNMLNSRSQQPEAAVAQKTETSDVLVATKDFQMGDKLTEGLAWKAWPKDSVTELMITRDRRPDALKELATALVRMPVFKDEPVISKKVVVPGAGGFMSANLPKGMRAEAVAISTKSSAGGFILPNDRVDVILTKKNPSQQNGAAIVKSETVVSNVKVLAVNQVFKQANEGDQVTVDKGETATLELTPEQAEVMATVQSSGELSLVLRSIAENDGKSEEEIQPVLADKYQNKPNRNIISEPMIIRAGVESRAVAQ